MENVLRKALYDIGYSEYGVNGIIEVIKKDDYHCPVAVTDSENLFWYKSVDSFKKLPKNVKTKYAIAIDLKKTNKEETYVFFFSNNTWSNKSIHVE